ncbi:MAG: hypothetical protein KatS3mg010_0762 [Acidimicrobiia bacterium]|nr:MAG: hypothetical protein KatS3mg010_0762 [Acidimicrobiia bacterium]
MLAEVYNRLPLDPEAVAGAGTSMSRAAAAPLHRRHRPLVHEALDAGQQVLFEGAQATFLDLDHGTYPYVTSSNPVAGGACTGAGIGPRDIDRVVGIAKAYVHPGRCRAVPDRAVRRGRRPARRPWHEYGTNTGRRRRTGWFDAVMLRHAVRLNTLYRAGITKLDVLDTLDTRSRCAWPTRSTGTRYEHLPYHQSTCTPRAGVRGAAGVADGPHGGHRTGELPAAAADYLSFLEEQIGVPIASWASVPAASSSCTRPRAV